MAGNENSWSTEKEKEILEEWKLSNPFNVDHESKKIYSIDTPPPYVNSPVHIGQAITYCYMDFFARYKRMKGYSVVFPLGLDRNGLPIEMAAEKKFKVNAHKVGREVFIEYCKKILEESSSETMDTFLRMGVSFSSYKFGNKPGDAYMTDSPEYRALTQSTFYDMWEKGLVYEDLKVVNFCPGCHTTLADAEIEYEEKTTTLVHLKFKIKESSEEVVVATTRPELLGACVVVLCNPNDERYKKHLGKKLLTPFYGKEVLIKQHASADKDFGSGLVMMCSFGDLTDIRYFRDENIKPIILINEDGRMNENSGKLNGLKISEARRKIIEELKEQGLVVKEETINHRAPVCERSKDQVEFIEMQEYYLKQMMFKEKLLELGKEMKFFSESSRNIFENWLNSLSQDWPLSRRRYYATPIPLWKCPKCNEVILGEKGKYVEPWKNEKECKKCKVLAIPETRVFDTWFDSSISELYILGYERDNRFFNKAYPCSLRPQGKEIIRTWLYYTFLRAYLLTGKACFKDVWINYHILDENKRKMSKSKGNVIDPKEILKNEGSEALRLWSALEGEITTSDFGCSREKIRSEQKTLTKLWNVGKFVMQFKETRRPKNISKLDKLFIEHMEMLEDYCDKCYSVYDFHNPAVKLREYIWETFASHYLELVKPRAYNKDNKFTKAENESALYTIRHLFERLLVLSYPIIPAITYSLYKKCGKEIFKERFIDHDKEKTFEGLDKIEILKDLNSKVWRAKKEKMLSLNSQVKELVVPNSLKDYEKDLSLCHNSIKMDYGDFDIVYL